MIKAEREILGRSDDELTSYAGYAGARKPPKEGRLCYHNFRGVGDYGKAGAGEVSSSGAPHSGSRLHGEVKALVVPCESLLRHASQVIASYALGGCQSPTTAHAHWWVRHVSTVPLSPSVTIKVWRRSSVSLRPPGTESTRPGGAFVPFRSMRWRPISDYRTQARSESLEPQPVYMKGLLGRTPASVFHGKGGKVVRLKN